MLKAYAQDYKNAFYKHYHAYINWNNTGSIISKRIILSYCVECGLKYLLMKQERLFSIESARDDLKNVLTSHDIQSILTKHLRQPSFVFPVFNTIHGQPVNSSKYHQAYRYALCPLDSDEIKCVMFYKELEKVSTWLNERVCN